MKEITVTLELTDNEYDYLVGLNALDTVYLGLPFSLSFETSVSTRIRTLMSNHLARYLYYDREFYCMALPEMEKGAELEDVLERYPALSMELGSDGTTFETPQSERDGEAGDVPARNPSPEAGPEEPETMVTVRDVSGVVREVTLDEAEEMREAAQGIYAGEAPEPDFEPDAPERESETVSNAKDKRSPLIKDNSDGYFYYLEHGHWPPDDEVLAGADVPCTGDYGLSDCLVVTQSALDFVDAFFVGQGREHET